MRIKFIVMGRRVCWLSPCKWRMPLHTRCKRLSSVGSGILFSMWCRRMAAKYTLIVLYDTDWDSKHKNIAMLGMMLGLE